MRLAFLTHEPFYPASGGGSAEAIYLVEELVRRGHEVHVFSPQLADAAAVEQRFGIRLHAFTAWRMGRYARLRNVKYLLYPFFLERLVLAAARTLDFDLVLSQHAIAAVTAGRLRQKLNRPVVMNFLDYLTAFMETWPAWIAPPRVVAALKRFEISLPSKYQADAVLTVSDTLADLFADAGYPRARLRAIYYGFDAALFPPPAAVPPAGRPVIVMHGSFDQHHLGPIIRAAMVAVAVARPDVVFRFVGQRTPALTRLVSELGPRLGPEQIECTGFVPYEAVARQLATATLGIVPYEESTGTHCAFVAKIVEYLAVGLPVVSTPLQSARRYFADEPAVRFAGFDGASFAREMLAALAEPAGLRAARGLKASERVRAELDWRVLSRRAIDFVEQHQRPRGTSAK